MEFFSIVFLWAYRVIAVNYENGSGQDRFLFNMTTFEAVLRFGFNFSIVMAIE